MIRPLFAAMAGAATVLLSPLCQGALAADNEPRIIDGIAAIVNGDIITYSQVRGLPAPRERLLRTQYHGEELDKHSHAARGAAAQDLKDGQVIVQLLHQPYSQP